MVICLRVKMGFSCRGLLEETKVLLLCAWLMAWWAGSMSIMGSGEDGDELGEGGHTEVPAIQTGVIF
jgi:hypothetical protein